MTMVVSSSGVIRYGTVTDSGKYRVVVKYED